MPNNANEPSRPFDAIAWLERLDEDGGRHDAVPTGFPSVDALLNGGPRRGDLVVLAGDLGAGKSALAMAIALRASEAGLDAALFSGELGTARLFERALAMRAKVRVDDLRRGTLTEAQRAQAGTAALALRDRCPLLAYMPPNGFGGMSDLLIDHLGIDLVVVDPIQSLVTGRLPRDEELASVALELKGLAVRRECMVLVVSHLDRTVRERNDPRPQLADLGAQGALGQQADIVLGLYREEQYHAERDVDGAAEVHVLKQRDGSLGYADLFFYKQWVRFEDVVER